MAEQDTSLSAAHVHNTCSSESTSYSVTFCAVSSQKMHSSARPVQTHEYCRSGAWTRHTWPCATCQHTHTHTHLLKFFEILRQTVYNIKMKWEATGVHTDWCDARLSSLPQPNLTVKGVPCTPCSTPATSLWDRWPDRSSPNYPTVLGSMIPALKGKSTTLAGDRDVMSCNVRTIVQGCGYTHYQWKWWWQHIRVRFKHRGLVHLTPLSKVKEWYAQGRTWAG